MATAGKAGRNEDSKWHLIANLLQGEGEDGSARKLRLSSGSPGRVARLCECERGVGKTIILIMMELKIATTIYKLTPFPNRQVKAEAWSFTWTHCSVQ